MNASIVALSHVTRSPATRMPSATIPRSESALRLLFLATLYVSLTLLPATKPVFPDALSKPSSTKHQKTALDTPKTPSSVSSRALWLLAKSKLSLESRRRSADRFYRPSHSSRLLSINSCIIHDMSNQGYYQGGPQYPQQRCVSSHQSLGWLWRPLWAAPSPRR